MLEARLNSVGPGEVKGFVLRQKPKKNRNIAAYTHYNGASISHSPYTLFLGETKEYNGVQ